MDTNITARAKGRNCTNATVITTFSSPAGGVATGWQVVLRSRNIYGPYENRTVLAQGNSPVNGPHQGGWMDTPTGEDWFMHFQDVGAYGRSTSTTHEVD